MTHRMAVAGVVAGAWLLAVPVGAAAQVERAPGAYDRELGAGYSFLREEGYNFPLGLAVDFAGRVAGGGAARVQIVAEVSVNRFLEDEEFAGTTYTQFAAGVRVGGAGAGGVRPFAQFLAGLERADGDTSGVLMPGAGLNVALSRVVDLRLQVDLPFVRYDGETYRQFRFNVGVAIPLGGK